MMGQLFSLLVYAGLVLEAAPAWGVADELLDVMSGVFVRDFNGYADLLGKTSTTSEQANLARVILRQPAVDPGRLTPGLHQGARAAELAANLGKLSGRGCQMSKIQ